MHQVHAVLTAACPTTIDSPAAENDIVGVVESS
jgi:hypothetical protein